MTTRDPVWHAGRLVQWGLRPLTRPAQEAEYRELVERYFDDGAFRTTVRELADGLGLHVLDVSEHGLVLAPQDDSIFALKPGDFRPSSSKADDRLLDGLAQIAIAATVFPRAQDLDEDPDIVRAPVTVDEVEAQLRQLCERLSEETRGAPDPNAAPLKYRSLQLTGDEKMLASFAATSLFGPARLTFELLGCQPDALPLAWEEVGTGSRLLIFENAGPFAVARRILGELTTRPYDLVAYGGGRSVLAGLGHIQTIDRAVDSIHYVGDIDDAGLDIAWNARQRATRLGLPRLLPATELHRQMLIAARSFGHVNGWPTRKRLSDLERCRGLSVLDPEVHTEAERLLAAGRRIPEEVLGPSEFRAAWTNSD